MTEPRATITVTLPVADKPDVLDWLSRKAIVTPRSITLTYQPGVTGPVTVDVTGPARPAPGIQPFHGEMTVTFDHRHPEHWPRWVRDLGASHTPPGPA